jgi:hypothetical protein
MKFLLRVLSRLGLGLLVSALSWWVIKPGFFASIFAFFR